MNRFTIPEQVGVMARRGPRWADWVAALPPTVERVSANWRLRPDGTGLCGHCSVVLPVLNSEGVTAMLKIGFPDQDSEHEHLALRRWGGRGAVRLLAADPHTRALLLERLATEDISGLPETTALEVVAGLYRQLHAPALASLRTLASFIDVQTSELANLPRAAPIPRRLVEQAVALGRDLSADRSVPDRVLHTDLHYANVLRGAEGWLAIDPKPINGDPHYEPAPMLWNRWDEISGDVRDGVRRRFWTLVDAAGFDEDRARAWVIVRMVHNAMWAIQDGLRAAPGWLTRCVAVAKAVQD